MEINERKRRGVRYKVSGLVRDHFLFFLEWGSMTNFAKPSAFSRSLKSFAGTLDFFADPPPFAERSEAGVPFGDAEWSGAKWRRVRKNSRWLQANSFKDRENCRRLCKIVKDPIPNKKNGSDPLRTTHLYRTHRLFREIKFSYVLKSTSLKVI